jgi:hypothetical protein
LKVFAAKLGWPASTQKQSHLPAWTWTRLWGRWWTPAVCSAASPHLTPPPVSVHPGDTAVPFPEVKYWEIIKFYQTFYMYLFNFLVEPDIFQRWLVKFS